MTGFLAPRFFPFLVVLLCGALAGGCSGSKGGGTGSAQSGGGNGSGAHSGGPGGGSAQGSSGQGGSTGSSASSGSEGGGSGSSGSSDGNAIAIPPDQQRIAGIRVVALQPREVPRTLTVPGQIAIDEQRTSHISPYADGKITEILRNVGDPVRRGETLARMHSHTIHETAGVLAMNFDNLARSDAALTYAQGKRDRYAHLYSIQAASLEQQQTSQQELVQAQTDVQNAQAAVTMEREHLGDLLSVPPESITPSNLYSFELIPLISPISGVVLTRSVTPGMVLQLGQEAYTVANLDEVWMMASVTQNDLNHLRVGERAIVRTDAWPNETFAGTVTLIGSTLDPTTRTLQVRVSVPNRAGKLHPLMFATAAIDEAQAPSGGGARQALFVPEDALQEINGVPSIFVTADGTHFTPRALKTAPPVRGQVEVTDGLRPGEHVAVAGSFVLKSALLKSTIDSE